MLAALAVLFLTALSSRVAAAPQVSETQYFTGLDETFTQHGLGSFVNALKVANTTQSGYNLVHSLYSDRSFTLYVPVNTAWETSGLTNPTPSEDLNSLLSYHIVTSAINSTEVAVPRQHTIGSTLLKTSTVLLPGDQTQVVVLETTPQGVNGTILVRGDSWNATSVGAQFQYENLLVQPVDKILEVPSPLIKTLSKPGLALSATLGATSFVNGVSTANLNTILQSGPFTFFVPVNSAFDASYANLDSTAWTALIQNHVLNGTVAYSTVINPGNTFETTTGKTIGVATNTTGRYLTSGSSAARILRADIPVSNGVIHLIDNILSGSAASNNSQTLGPAAVTSGLSTQSNSAKVPSSTATSSVVPCLDSKAALMVAMLATLGSILLA